MPILASAPLSPSRPTSRQIDRPPQHMVNRGLHFLNPRNVIAMHDERMVDELFANKVSTLVAGQPHGKQAALCASTSAAAILREAPLVEIATTTSPGRLLAINCRENISSTPTSLPMALNTAGSAENEIAGIGREPSELATQSSTKSLASVAEPPLPNTNSAPPASTRRAMAIAASANGPDCSAANRERRRSSSRAFWQIDRATSTRAQSPRLRSSRREKDKESSRRQGPRHRDGRRLQVREIHARFPRACDTSLRRALDAPTHRRWAPEAARRPNGSTINR